MERLSKKGHEIRVIDHEILWKEDNKGELVSKKNCFYKVHKAISEGDITVIRPPIIKLPIIEYLSYIYTRRKEIKEQIKTFEPDVIVGFGILNPNIGIKLAKKMVYHLFITQSTRTLDLFHKHIFDGSPSISKAKT